MRQHNIQSSVTSRCLWASTLPHEDYLPVWQLRCLAEQAAELYTSAEAQRLALLHHAHIMRTHAPTTVRRRLWDDFARALDLDRTGAGARKGER